MAVLRSQIASRQKSLMFRYYEPDLFLFHRELAGHPVGISLHALHRLVYLLKGEVVLLKEIFSVLHRGLHHAAEMVAVKLHHRVVVVGITLRRQLSPALRQHGVDDVGGEVEHEVYSFHTMRSVIPKFSIHNEVTLLHHDAVIFPLARKSGFCEQRHRLVGEVVLLAHDMYDIDAPTSTAADPEMTYLTVMSSNIPTPRRATVITMVHMMLMRTKMVLLFFILGLCWFVCWFSAAKIHSPRAAFCTDIEIPHLQSTNEGIIRRL